MSKQTIDRSRKSVVVTHKASEDKVVILSSQDSLSLKEALAGHDLKLSSQDLYVFAEGFTLGKIQAKNLVMYANNLYDTNGMIINVSGTDGSKNGQDGTNSGNVFLYIEDISSQIKTNQWFNIHAIGGGGGEGNNGIGGNQNGGNGGNGGNVRLSMVHPYKMLLNKLSKMLHNNKVVEQKQITELIKIINSVPYIKESVAISDSIQKLNDMPSIDSITIQRSCLLDLYSVINVLTTNWENQNAYISVQEGNYGVHGTQGGKNGSSGNPGTIKCELVESSSCIITPYIQFSTPHLEQLSMVLDRAKMQYAFLSATKDGKLNNAQLSNIFDLLYKVKSRTESYIKLNDDLAIEQIDHYLDSTTESAIKVLNTEASNYLTQLQKGIDYFAYTSEYVPVISIQLIQKYLKDLYDNFVTIDNAYEKLLIQNNTLEEKKENAKIMLNAIEVKITQCKSQIDLLDQQYISKSENLILDYQNLLSQKKNILDKVMDQYDKLIKNYISDLKEHNFDFNIKSLLGCLSMVAFAPESKCMLVTQLAEFVEEGISNTTTSSGERVNKDFLIRKLTVEEANLKSLSDKFIKGNTKLAVDATGLIKLDKEENNMMIVQEQALFKQLDEFYKVLQQDIDSINEIKKSIKDYVKIVTQRNTEILHYNDYVALLSKAINNKQILENQLSSIQNEMLKDLNSESSSLGKFVSDSYYTMRDDILHTLNLVERAYKLWTLDTQDVFSSQIFKNGVVDLNKEVLSVIQEQLVKNIMDYIITHPTIGGKFKESYVINSDTDDDIDMLNDLRENKVLILKIKHGDPKASKLDYLEGAARISDVYPYIHGIKYINKENNTLLDGKLRGKITHGREENFSTFFNFSHDPIIKNFGYNLKQPKYEYSKSCATEEANFEVPGATDETSHPILSPFTEWTIEIAPDDTVDLSGINSLELVFEGLYFT